MCGTCSKKSYKFKFRPGKKWTLADYVNKESSPRHIIDLLHSSSYRRLWDDQIRQDDVIINDIRASLSSRVSLFKVKGPSVPAEGRSPKKKQRIGWPFFKLNKMLLCKLVYLNFYKSRDPVFLSVMRWLVWNRLTLNGKTLYYPILHPDPQRAQGLQMRRDVGFFN